MLCLILASMRWLLLGGVGALLLACEPSAPQSISKSTTAHEAAASAAPVRGRTVGGEPVPRQVEWPEAASADLGVRARLSRATLDKLSSSPAPVLVPERGGWAQLGMLHIGPSWTVFEAHEDDVHLNLSASTLSRRYPNMRGVELTDTVRGQPAIVTQNERIWSASWIEHGVAYALELECGAGKTVCDDDRELRELAESLVFVGPSEESQQ